MAYDRDRQSGSEAVLIVVIVLLVLVGGLCVVGLGGLFFARNASAQRQALVAEERALIAQEQAELARAHAQQALDRDPVVAEVEEGELVEFIDADREHDAGTGDTARIAVRIDSHGNVQMNEEPKSVDELRKELEPIAVGTASMLSVDIEVDEECLFKHVAKVLKLCESLEIKDVRLSSLASDTSE